MLKKIILTLAILTSSCFSQRDTINPVIDGFGIADTIYYDNIMPFCFIVKEKSLLQVNLVIDSAVAGGTNIRWSVAPGFQLFDYRKMGDLTVIAGLYSGPLLTEGWHHMLLVAQDSSYNVSYRGWDGFFKKKTDTLRTREIFFVHGISNTTYVDTTSTYTRDSVRLPPGSVPISRQYSSTTKKVTYYYLKPKP